MGIMPPDATPLSIRSRACRRVMRGDEPASRVEHALDVGLEHEPFTFESARKMSCRSVGVYVQYRALGAMGIEIKGARRYHRNCTGVDCLLNERRVHRLDAADEAKFGIEQVCLKQSAGDTGDAYRRSSASRDLGDDLGVDQAAQNGDSHFKRRPVGLAQAADEHRLDTLLAYPVGDYLAAAVHHHGVKS